MSTPDFRDITFPHAFLLADMLREATARELQSLVIEIAHAIESVAKSPTATITVSHRVPCFDLLVAYSRGSKGPTGSTFLVNAHFCDRVNFEAHRRLHEALESSKENP